MLFHTKAADKLGWRNTRDQKLYTNVIGSSSEFKRTQQYPPGTNLMEDID